MHKSQRYLVVGLLALFHLPLFAQSLPIAAPVTCDASQPKVDKAGYVRIGGIEQWVTIRGDNCANPVILFVHGGPGNPNTPYANGPYRPWEKQFTLVEWDQRGAGRTFARNPVKAGEHGPTLTVERIAQDGTELASLVLSHLKASKAILMGGSWGSVVAVHMAKARPELFSAYIGTGQLVSQTENLPASYAKLLAKARTTGDAKAIAVLEGLGAPPWTNPRAMGMMRRLSRPYEAKIAMPAPAAWLALAPAYATPQALADYEQGEDYSWLQFVGIKGNGMLSTIDLTSLGPEFKLPVFLVQGEDDLVTVPEVAKRYFDAISAPQKEYFLLPRTGHDPNPPMIDAQWRIVTTRVYR